MTAPVTLAPRDSISRKAAPSVRRARPAWQAALISAKVAAFEALSPEDREAAALARQQVREKSNARKAAAREHARRIFKLYFEGNTASEIARAVGTHADRIRRFAASRGVLISRSEATAHFAVDVTIDRRESLRRMAADHGATPRQAIEDLLTFVLDDDGRSPGGSCG